MVLPSFLLLFGIGFLAANLRAVTQHVQYLRRKRTALLTWAGRRPPLFGLQIGIAAALGLLIAFNLIFRVPSPETLFGEGMMFIYYAYAVPIGARIERGFYRDGAWADRGFMPYARVDAVAWREGKDPVLLLASSGGGSARRLTVPAVQYGAARRILRDLIAAHTIRPAGQGLDLGVRDEREDA